MVSNIYYVGKIKISNKMFARAVVTCDAVTQAFGVCVKFVEKNHSILNVVMASEPANFFWVKGFVLCQSQDNDQKRTPFLKDYFCLEMS